MCKNKKKVQIELWILLMYLQSDIEMDRQNGNLMYDVF